MFGEAQPEDLLSRAQMQAAEKFKMPQATQSAPAMPKVKYIFIVISYHCSETDAAFLESTIFFKLYILNWTKNDWWLFCGHPKIDYLSRCRQSGKSQDFRLNL